MPSGLLFGVEIAFSGSQVIVNGEVLGNMSAREYFSHKKELIPDIMKAYHALGRTV